MQKTAQCQSGREQQNDQNAGEDMVPGECGVSGKQKYRGKHNKLENPQPLIVHVIELLSDADENIRVEALSALLEIGESAIPFLKKSVKSKQLKHVV